MNARRFTPLSTSPGLALFAKLVVVMTFALVLLGGLVTTFGAGMAVPTWPTIHGEMNPPGWWQQNHVLLEHGHRLTAIAVGVLTAILCAWIWRNGWGLVAAFIVSGLADPIGRALHLEGNVIAHLRIWPAAVVFLALQFWRRPALLAREHWLALAAYLAVCVQATLGGLRVTQETAGALDAAMILRVVHGCFAQVFLAILVVLAALLSPAWERIRPSQQLGGIAKLGRIAIALIFLQLIVGAAMRHLGAGLAIPTFPHATPDGGWLPKIHNVFVDLNFTHTRVGSVVITLLLLHLGASAFRKANGESLFVRPALLLGGLIVAQFILGMFVIWHIRPPIITTLHVVNGAAVLATLVLLTVRATRASRLPVRAIARPVEVPA